MRVHIGSDHAGFELKNHVVRTLVDEGYEVVDHGPPSYDPEDDYPVYCIPAAEAVVAEAGALCVVIGGSGNGEQIAANKVIGTRAALAYDLNTAQLARQHNDANVISFGARMHTEDDVMIMIRAFLTTPFSGDPRHARRIAQLAAYEQSRQPVTKS